MRCSAAGLTLDQNEQDEVRASQQCRSVERSRRTVVYNIW